MSEEQIRRENRNARAAYRYALKTGWTCTFEEWKVWYDNRKLLTKCRGLVKTIKQGLHEKKKEAGNDQTSK